MKNCAQLLLLTLLPVALSAQAPAPQPPTPVATACLPATTLEDLPRALDAAITGPANKDRTCLRQLMSPDLRMIVLTPSGQRMLTLDDWIARQTSRGDSYLEERQIKVKSERFGKIAHLWSTYEVRTAPGGQPIARGLNSVQAIFDGTSWKLISILWQNEDAETPVPAQYLP